MAEAMSHFQVKSIVKKQIISKGIDIQTIAGRLGHSTSSTPQNVYSHFLEIRNRQASDMIDDVFSK